jgi:EmrB/QacA subfamily drug resistance transporter
MAGVMVTAVDTSVVVLAIPALQVELHVGLASVVWVVSAYLLALTLLATQAGRLGDMFGRVRMYEGGLVVFVVGSALCACAWDQASLVGFRVLQGVGGAMVASNSGAVLAELFPRDQRGRAFGYNSVAWSAGAVVGVLVGGVVVTWTSWRWIFWINVPIGLAAAAGCLWALSQAPGRQRHRLDLAGMATLGSGLLGVLWAATELTAAAPDPWILFCLVGGVGLLAAFFWVERGQEEPMLQLSLFRLPAMAPALLACLLQGLANFSVLFLVVTYLQGPCRLSPLQASMLLVPGYVIGGLVGPAAGRMVDRVGPLAPATLGLSVQVVALFLFTHLSTESSQWLVVVASAVNAAGASCFFPANSAAVMKASPPEAFGLSSGMLRTFANVGMVLSRSLAVLVAARSVAGPGAMTAFVGSGPWHPDAAQAFTSGLRTSLYVSMALMALAALLSVTRGHRLLRPATAS